MATFYFAQSLPPRFAGAQEQTFTPRPNQSTNSIRDDEEEDDEEEDSSDNEGEMEEKAEEEVEERAEEKAEEKSEDQMESQAIQTTHRGSSASEIDAGSEYARSFSSPLSFPLLSSSPPGSILTSP